MTISFRGPVLALALALACAVLAPATSSATPSQRITNGTKVGAGAFDQRWRSIVSLRGPAFPDNKGRVRSAQDMHECGGTLIRADIVVTAAHCVSHSRVLLTGSTVLGGTRRLSDGRRSFGTVVKVRETVVHPRYVDDFFSSQMGYDIAVLRLARPMPGAVPIPMVRADEAHLWGAGEGRRSARVAGWGLTAPVITERMWERERHPALEAQTQLREVEIPLMADRFCASTDSAMGDSAVEFDRATMLCGGTRDGVKGLPTKRKGACMGDSGGPLAVTGADGAPRLAGIVSWGPSDAGPCNRTSVFTRVDALRGWVEQTVAAMDAPAAISLPATLRGRAVSFDSLRVEWDEVTGPVERLRLVRDVSLEQLYSEQYGALGPMHPKLRRALRDTRLLLELGSTGEGARSLHARWLAPRTAGARRAYRLRLEASDGNGRTVLGPPVDIRPAVDSSRPGRPRPRLYMEREGVPGITWRPVRDNHCVLYYAVQVRRAGTGAWRTHEQRDSASCHRDIDDDWFEYEGDATRVGFYERRPGRYAVRVVAVDKAGNRSMSEPRIVRVRRNVEESDLPSTCRLRGDRVVCVFPKDEF